MKKWLVLLITIITTYSLYPQGNWQWLTPEPPYAMVYSSIIIDNKAYFWCQNNCVIKLDILNENFEMMPTYAPYGNCAPGDFTSQGIAFSDSNNGFVSDVCYGEFRTTNGGYTWTKTSGNSEMILFATDKVGWKFSGGGLYRTSNSGNSWTFLGGPVGGWGEGGNISKLFATDQYNLWVIKSSYSNGSNAYVWFSSNAGTNWSKIDTGLQSDSLYQISFLDMTINHSGMGSIIGYAYDFTAYSFEGIIVKTTDMGLTWSSQQFPNERFEQIHSLDQKDLVVHGNIGFYNNSIVIQRKTTDAGETWLLSYPLSGLVNSPIFYNSIYSSLTDKIYMLATRGIYRSADRGLTYEKVTSEKDVIVNDIAFDSKPPDINNQLAIAYIKHTSYPFLISFDCGYTWSKRSFPPIGGYLWLVGIAEEVIYIIVDQNKLFKSIDKGESWQQLSVPVYNSGLQALCVFNKDVFSLTSYKNLVSSTDGGESWILGPTVENLWWKSTGLSNPGTLIGVGSYFDSTGTKGFIVNSSDFGLSWHLIDTDDELDKVVVKGENTGYILSSKRIYRTTDSGNIWKIRLSASTNEGFYQFAFLDSLTGIVAAGSVFKNTYDGAQSWTSQDYRIPLPGVQNMEFNAKGDLFITGGGSMIMVPASNNDSPNNDNRVTQINNSYRLFNAFPNPFNNTTKIRYQVPDNSLVVIKIYNALGEELEVLVSEEKSAGTFDVGFNATNLSSGIYFYQIRAGNFVDTKKMILLK